MNQIIYATICEGKYEYIQYYSKEFYITNDDSNIRMDLTVEKNELYKIWGQVKSLDGAPVEGATVNLLKPFYMYGKLEYTCINTTKSDFMGFYHFEVDKDESNIKYRVMSI